MASFLLVSAILVAIIAAAVYFLGIPAEWKENIQEQIARYFAESKAKDMMQDQLGKLPESDRKNAEALSSGIEKLSGGKADLKNPLGGIMGSKDD